MIPVPDLPPVEATGKEVELPESTYSFDVRGSKIGNISVLVAPGGGFQGMFNQLGAKLPSPERIPG